MPGGNANLNLAVKCKSAKCCTESLQPAQLVCAVVNSDCTSWMPRGT